MQTLLCYRPQRTWGKVIFSQACVILFTGRGCLVGGWWLVPGPGGCMVWGGAWSQGGAWSRGVCVPGPGGCVCLVWGVCLVPGGVASWWRPPRDGYCCGRYASYWNAILFFLCCVFFVQRTQIPRRRIKIHHTPRDIDIRT